MNADATKAETKQSILLWFGILAAPAAWTLQVLLAPDLAEVLCYEAAAGSGRGEIYGLGMEPFLVVLTGLMAVVALLGVIVSLSCRRKLRRTSDPAAGGRAGWMALAGILVSVLFFVAIVVGFFPMIFLESCVVSP
jgi:hypothetical protein